MAPSPKDTFLLRRYAISLTAMILFWSAALSSQTTPSTPAAGNPAPAQSQATDQPNQPAAPANPQQPSPQETSPSSFPLSAYEGKLVQTIELPGVEQRDRGHLLQLLPQQAGVPLDRAQVGDSIRALYATGRFADIQAEVAPSSEGVVLTFATSANFFVGAVDVEGAPDHPNANQIVNASKFQLGERYTREKMNRALENIRQLLQADGYYRALVTSETTSNEATQQVDVLFHIKAGEPAHVGEVTVTGTSGSAAQSTTVNLQVN